MRRMNDLFSYGIAFGISKELLEDAIHDVFLHLYEREHKLWESQNMKFYLLNCLKNRIRTIKKKEMNTEFLEEGSDNYSFLIEVNGFELIDEEKERAAMQKQLKKMLDSLTDRQREAVYLRYTQGLSYEEIGKLMGIQPKAAQKFISHKFPSPTGDLYFSIPSPQFLVNTDCITQFAWEMIFQKYKFIFHYKKLSKCLFYAVRGKTNIF